MWRKHFSLFMFFVCDVARKTCVIDTDPLKYKVFKMITFFIDPLTLQNLSSNSANSNVHALWQIPNKDQVKDQLAETEKKVFTGDSSSDWLGSDRDYTYDELLTRVFNIIREKNPDMITGEKKKFVMKPPQVARVGTKKTSFSNFADICKLLRRQEKHLLNFLLAELGTSGSLDIQKQLTIKGRFQQKQIENVLRRYISNKIRRAQMWNSTR